MRRQTYYISEDLIKALSVFSAYEGKDKSKIVREALDKFIPEKYKKTIIKLEE